MLGLRLRPVGIAGAAGVARVLRHEGSRPPPTGPDECKGDRGSFRSDLSRSRQAIGFAQIRACASWAGRDCFSPRASARRAIAMATIRSPVAE
jgi:hypothetical protein